MSGNQDILCYVLRHGGVVSLEEMSAMSATEVPVSQDSSQ